MTLPTHRGGECSHCEGLGVDIYACDSLTHDTYDDNEACPHCPECDACEGTGELAWAWEPDTRHGECAHCGAEDVDTMPSGEDGEEPACLVCVTRWHAKSCGCDLWPKMPRESDK